MLTGKLQIKCRRCIWTPWLRSKGGLIQLKRLGTCSAPFLVRVCLLAAVSCRQGVAESATTGQAELHHSCSLYCLGYVASCSTNMLSGGSIRRCPNSYGSAAGI